ncbi:MAG: hypothetical protein Q4D56_03945 [Bacteroides sp.]|nr:hypothetical protein [Bacteroides sp.]
MDAKENKDMKSASQQKNDAFILKFTTVLLILNACLVLFSLGYIIWELQEEGELPIALCFTTLVLALNIFVLCRNMKERKRFF